MEFTLDDRYTLEDGRIYVSGIQALVRTVRDRALLDRQRGLRTGSFISGYEGSPLAGYDMELARRMRLMDGLSVVHRPAVNEELAATSVMGTQLAAQVGSLNVDGVTGYWYGKGPGLDRASDAIRHANMIGTDPQGGAVAFVGDDPAAKSSSVTCYSEFALADLQVPTLYPADPQEVLDLGIHAAYLSRHSGLWSALKIVTAVADGACSAVVTPDAVPALTALEPSTFRPDANLAAPGLMALERSLASQRLPRVWEYTRAHRLDRHVARSSDDRIGIVCAGKTYFDVVEALTSLGLDLADLSRHGIRLLKIGMIWPLDPHVITEFADGLQEIIVVEEKRSFLEAAVKEILYGRAGSPVVLGKTDDKGRELVSPVGELDSDAVSRALARRLGEVHRIEPVLAWREQPATTRTSLQLLTRTPYFCSGCPHNASTQVPDGSVVGAGIGCHGMVLLMDEKQTGRVIGLTQMGGEGAQWLGMAPFVDQDHFIQNVGDGTFTHSGSLALRAAVASGENITYKILYNSTVAMTGGQDPVGELSLPRLVQLLRAEGVSKIVVTSEDLRRAKAQGLPKDVELRDRADIVDIQSEFSAIPGVTVLIHDQECAAEKRRKRKRGQAETPATRVVINERICEGCGDCGEKSNCMSVQPVQTEFGRKTRIHQSSCNLDYSCLSGDCPSFVKVVPGKVKVARERVSDLSSESLPVPESSLANQAEFSMRLMGVGGTGVVTVAQILATAAAIDGKNVRAVDQTGLAQKGGAVVSDVRITDRLVASTIPDGGCDLYLVCDTLVGTDPKNLKAASPDRTVVVASTAEVPTGRMVIDTSIQFPPEAAVRENLEAASRRRVAVDAPGLSDQLFGHEQYANMLLVGVAYQVGQLPIAAEAIERAITLNGASSETNIQAFRRGRQIIADESALHTAIADTLPTPAPRIPHPAAEQLMTRIGSGAHVELVRTVSLRVEDLIRYQSVAYASEYIDFVERVRTAEEAAAPGSDDLTRAVATYLYKLMAYKDEYEVARLVLDDEWRASVTGEFGPDASVAVQLHPPMLRSLGLKRKLSFGPRARPMFALLRAARRLRGTRLDIFGYHPVRRTERALVREYRTMIADILPRLTPLVLASATKLASLPDAVRGYEQIKLDNVVDYRRQVEALKAEIHDAATLSPT